jgi:hypothetical protein
MSPAIVLLPFGYLRTVVSLISLGLSEPDIINLRTAFGFPA